jgi:hypothetical protein
LLLVVLWRTRPNRSPDAKSRLSTLSFWSAPAAWHPAFAQFGMKICRCISSLVLGQSDATGEAGSAVQPTQPAMNATDVLAATSKSAREWRATT